MSTRIVFDAWTLLTDTGELWRGGSRRRLPAQALQVLTSLLRRPGELVPRDELVALLWPDTVVDYDAGLNAIVRKLRLALEDDAERPRYIETVPRRGYRYIGPPPVNQADATPAAPPAAVAPVQPPARRPRRAVAAGLVGLMLIAGWWAWRESSRSPMAVSAAAPPTANADAYDAYLKARLAYRDGDWLGAHVLASTAIARDPDFGSAYLARAAAAGMAIVFNVDATEARLAAMYADLQRARRLSGERDPMLIGVDAMYASVGGRDHTRSLARFAEAEAAGLSDPTMLRTRAMQLVVMNRLDDAIAAHRSLAALDPDNFVLVNMTASLLSLARRPDEALRMSRLVRERFPRQATGALTHGRLVFAFTGATDEWRAALDRAAGLRPDQRLQETFDLLRYERRERDLIAALPTRPDAVVSAGTFNGLTLCCVGSRPVAQYRGWAAILMGDTDRAAREGREVLAFANREPRTRWNGWYLELLRAEGLLMMGRREEAVVTAQRALSPMERANNLVHWRYAAALAARVFAWGGEKTRAVIQLEALERARPGLRPAEITHDPFYLVPLAGEPRFEALRRSLRQAMRTSE